MTALAKLTLALLCILVAPLALAAAAFLPLFDLDVVRRPV